MEENELLRSAACIDLFAGQAGVYLATRRIGIPTVLALDLEEKCRAILAASGCSTPVQADIRTWDMAAWLATAKGAQWVAAATRLFWASTPCKGWSNAGLKRGEHDPRNLYPETLAQLDVLIDAGAPPTALVFENIVSKRLLAYLERYVIPELEKRFRHVALWQLDAADFGVPQHRARYFIVAGDVVVHEPLPLPCPRPTPHTIFGAGWLRRENTGAKGRPTNMPAPAITACDNLYFYTEDPGVRAEKSHLGPGARQVTAAESAALQGYPSWWASFVHATRQVGDAVPPPLAFTVVRAALGLTPRVWGDTLPPEGTVRPLRAHPHSGRRTTMAKATARPYATSIELELKNQATTLEGLTPRVLIIGTNGTGKSTWVDGLSLAETGQAEALAGKTRTDPGELFALAPGDADDEIGIKVDHSDGLIARWGATRKERNHRDGTTSTTVSKGKKNHHPYDTDMVFPLRALFSAVTDGGTARQRKFFLQAAGSALDIAAIRVAVAVTLADDADIDDATAESALRRFDTAAKVLTKKHPDPTALLLAVSKHASTEALQAGQRRDAASATVNKAAAGLSALPVDAEIAAAEATVTELRADLRKVHEAISVQAFSPYVDFATFVAEGRAKKKVLEDLTTALAQLPDATEADVDAARRARLMDGLEVITAAHVDKGYDKCVICGSEVGSDVLTARATTTRERVAAKRDEIAADTAQRADRKRLEEGIRGAEQAMVRVRAAIPEIKSREEIAPAVHEAEAAWEKLRTAKAEWKAVKAAEELVPVEKSAVIAWTNVAKGCKGAVTVLLAELAPAFAARVNRYLPTGWRFGLELFVDDREVCRWGLLRCGTCHGRGKVMGITCAACEGSGIGDVLHSYTSGGEWAATLASVAAATVPDDYKGLVVLALPDADFHPTVRREVMQALESFPGQVFVTATVKPAGAKLPNWTYIEFDEAKGEWKIRKGKKTMPKIGAEAAPAPKAKATKTKPPTTTTAAGDASGLEDDLGGDDPTPPPEVPASKVDPKAQYVEALGTLGYDAGQISKMKLDCARELADQGIGATEVSILADGSWVRPTKATGPSAERQAEIDDLLA